MTQQPSTPNRRRFLRRLGGTAAALGLASTAGCAASRAISAEGGGTNQFDGSDLDAAAFRDYRDEMRARYGDHGVFGARSPPDDSSFVTAWTDEFTTGESPWNDGDGLVRADYAVARYHLGESPDGDRMDAWLLWAGARPLAETARLPELPGGYEPKTSVRVRAFGVNLGFAGSLNLVHYTPDSAVKSSLTDRYMALSGSQSGVVVSADAPLETGTVRPKAPKTWDSPPVTGLEEDGYTVGWQGRSADAVSVVAVCTTALPPEADPSAVAVGFEHHVAAGGYLFE